MSAGWPCGGVEPPFSGITENGMVGRAGRCPGSDSFNSTPLSTPHPGQPYGGRTGAITDHSLDGAGRSDDDSAAGGRGIADDLYVGSSGGSSPVVGQ